MTDNNGLRERFEACRDPEIDALTQAAHERVDAILSRCWAEIKEQGMTWQEASELLGIAESTLDNWRTGRARPTATALFKMVYGLGVSI